MKCDRRNMLLYAVTDRAWLNGRALAGDVEAALKGGATFVQLREKNLEEDIFMKEAIEIQALCKKYNVPFVVNDNVDIAVAMNACGVHVGQGDMPVSDVRKKLGYDKIIGVTANTVEQAIQAEEEGADYLGVGAVFPTTSKADTKPLSYETLRSICSAVSIPVVAIGGITKDNVSELKDSGIDGVAVISAIFAKPDIEEATRQLKETVRDVVDWNI